jgi:hypothetical protein
VYAGTTWTNTDPFAEAITTADAEGGLIRFFVANPADYLAMLQIKKQTGSNEPLLGIDANQATRRTAYSAYGCCRPSTWLSAPCGESTPASHSPCCART